MNRSSALVFLALWSAVWAQVNLTGKVSDRDGSPLAAESVDMFADVLEQNKDIVAFTCAHHPSFINETYRPSDGWDQTYATVWMNAVKRHKARFGYVQ
jgi:hypothetical protein